MAQAAGICGVVLSAGASTRMGRDKALLPWPPVAPGVPAVNTFLGAMIDLLQGYCDLVVVVAGRNAESLQPVVDAHNAFLVVNPNPERGQFSSIQVGLQEVLNRGRDTALLAPVDRPPVLPGTLHALRETFLASGPDVWVIAPELSREGGVVHGHPVLLGRDMLERFLRASADATARDIMDAHREHIRYVSVADERVAANIDTPEDYERLLRAETIGAETTFSTQDNLRDQASQFQETVLALRPSLAVFDCDGTLWSGDSGRDFFYWEIERGIVERDVAAPMLKRYRLYQLGVVDELAMCGEMVTMNRGLPVEQLRSAAREFFEEVVGSRVFDDMRELTLRLADEGCEIWAVSSTNNWVVEAGVERFGIPRNRVLAACVNERDGLATDQLIRVPTDDLKAVAIREVIGRPVDGVFGNSVHDQAMLEIARHSFAVNPNVDLHEVAKSRNWTIYWPQSTAPAAR